MPEPIRTRVQRHRAHARDHGLVRVDVELPRHLVVALRRPDETLAALLCRALTALQQQVTAPSDQSLPETHIPAGDKLPETILYPGVLPETSLQTPKNFPETPLYPGVLPGTSEPLPRRLTVPETFPETGEIPAKDAPLVALLRQTPLLPYAEIAARLGISESQIKKKAAPWAKAGLVPQRPRGGARPRKATS
jgi:hypothetical protein